MTTHKQVKLSKLEWNQFNNLIEKHIKEPVVPDPKSKIKHNDYTIYQLLSFDTSFSDNKNLKLISISEDNPYYKDEGSKMKRIIVLPIKINNSKLTKINLELKNEDDKNKKQCNILNKDMIFCDTSNNKIFLNYEINENILIKDKNKLAYILFTIEKVSRNLTFGNYYNLYVKSNGKVLHKFKEISVRSKRKKRKPVSEETKNKILLPSKKRKPDFEENKVIPKKKKRKTEYDFTDTANDKSDKSDTIFTIKSFIDFITMTVNSLKRIESKVDKIKEDLNQLKKDQSNINNVNNISIKCFNDEYPKFDAILPSLGFEMEY